MASITKSPGTTSQVPDVGVDWTSPGNIVSSNNSWATASFNNTGLFSDALVASNFGFNLPPNSYITGAEIAIEASRDNTNRVVNIQYALLETMPDGSGDNLDTTNPAQALSTTDTIYTYGSTINLITGSIVNPNLVAVINNSNLSVVVGLSSGAGSGTTLGRIDHITLTIHYIQIDPGGVI